MRTRSCIYVYGVKEGDGEICLLTKIWCDTVTGKVCADYGGKGCRVKQVEKNETWKKLASEGWTRVVRELGLCKGLERYFSTSTSVEFGTHREFLAKSV